jgi:hypothetical protein
MHQPVEKVRSPDDVSAWRSREKYRHSAQRHEEFVQTHMAVTAAIKSNGNKYQENKQKTERPETIWRRRKGVERKSQTRARKRLSCSFATLPNTIVETLSTTRSLCKPGEQAQGLENVESIHSLTRSSSHTPTYYADPVSTNAWNKQGCLLWQASKLSVRH